MSDQTSNPSQNNVSMNIEENKEQKTVPDPPENITVPFVLLTNLHNILVAAGDRGAFKTAEMYDIGRVYNEVRTYLTQHLNTKNEVVEASSLPEPEFALNDNGDKN